MSKQYAHLHAMAKTSVKFQNDWPKTYRRSCAHKSIVDEQINGQMDRSRHAYIAPALARRCDKNVVSTLEEPRQGVSDE